GAAADHDRAAGGFADRAHRRSRCRDDDGRLWAGRRHDDGVAVRRLARRLCRHRGDRGGRLLSRQGHGGAPPQPPALATGGERAEHRLKIINLRTGSSFIGALRFGAGLLALGMAQGGVAYGGEPVKIRSAWVAPVTNWASIWLEKKDLAQHLGKSYTFEP